MEPTFKPPEGGKAVKPQRRSRLVSGLLALGLMCLVGAIGTAISTSSANADPTTATSPLSYSGQGIPVQQQCDANNTPYLLFIFAFGGNYSPTNVTLNGITVTSQEQFGNEIHFTTVYADPSSLIGQVTVTWDGEVGNAQLVISHGCAGTTTSTTPESSTPESSTPETTPVTTPETTPETTPVTTPVTTPHTTPSTPGHPTSHDIGTGIHSSPVPNNNTPGLPGAAPTDLPAAMESPWFKVLALLAILCLIGGVSLLFAPGRGRAH